VSAPRNADPEDSTPLEPEGHPLGKLLARLLRPLLTLLLLLAINAVFFFTSRSSPTDAVAWEPPPAPKLIGPLAPNTRLREARILAAGRVQEVEDVAVDPEGRIYGGTAGGWILRLTVDERGLEVERFARTGGRPLGLALARDGRLMVADALRGLLAVDRSGEVEVLASEAGRQPLGMPNGVDVAADGRVFFSDSSSRYGLERAAYDLAEGRPRGRLLVWDPESGTAEVVAGDLFFANGVAVSPGGEFVLVAETSRYRITRCWLRGDKAGTREVFADNLPGFPDGIARDRDGSFWVALFTLRDPRIDRYLRPYPWLTNQLAKIPRTLWPAPRAYPMVVVLDGEGHIVDSLQDPGGERLRQLTSAEPAGDAIFLATLDQPGIAQLAR
jgi:sugar lactone lactonase YvrE